MRSVRASSRRVAAGSRNFATDSRKFRAEFALSEGFTKVRDRFATGSHKFARVCAGHITQFHARVGAVSRHPSAGGNMTFRSA
eukprot:843084-Prymnesium_polylepis.1